MTACAEVLTRRRMSLTTHRAASLAAAHRILTIGKSQRFCEDTRVCAATCSTFLITVSCFAGNGFKHMQHEGRLLVAAVFGAEGNRPMPCTSLRCGSNTQLNPESYQLRFLVET
jgi:hypothetical protein